jgi:hypothetical protein
MEPSAEWTISIFTWLVRIAFAVVIGLCGWRCFRRTGKASFLLLTALVAILPIVFGVVWLLLSASRALDTYVQWRIAHLVAELLSKGLMIGAFAWLAVELGPARPAAVAAPVESAESPPLPADPRGE